MGHRFAEIAFTPTVKALQEQLGSRGAYLRAERSEMDLNYTLGPNEAGFIAARDSFYMASVGETGWPYIQHRGGPTGFVRVFDKNTIGLADFRGNRQYVSVGNLLKDDRVSLFFMDYPNRTRLKVFGRARIVDLKESETLEKLSVSGYRAKVERGFLVAVEAFDWNCPQHISPRFTLEQVEQSTEHLRQRVADLEIELEQARQRLIDI